MYNILYKSLLLFTSIRLFYIYIYTNIYQIYKNTNIYICKYIYIYIYIYIIISKLQNLKLM